MHAVALWLSHLGKHHDLTARDLNVLAVSSDLCGGHSRNVVFAATVLARSESRPIRYPDSLRGLETEYRKLGRTIPSEIPGQA